MKSILVIDDDDDVRDVIVFALESEGFNVLSAQNGKLGLDKLKALGEADYPGLIIVDYLMPEMDGKAFIKCLKTEYAQSLGKIPIIISSAMGNVSIGEEEYFNEIIRLYKPMDLDDLLKIVRENCA